MLNQILRYTVKLIHDHVAEAREIAFAAQDDIIIANGDSTRAALATDILGRLNCLALVIARPTLPFAEFLLKRSAASEHKIVPRDTETRTFLHDIPILRRSEFIGTGTESIAELLGQRKGIIVEGIGIIACGALTIEQAYINWSSIFHSTFIKYLEDLLSDGFRLPGEEFAFNQFRFEWLHPLSSEELTFMSGPFKEKSTILNEMAAVGRYTVTCGLVDSFFGNISYSNGDVIYISQTAASLDHLEGCIDPVPHGDSSTVGITASSELVAHRSIIESIGCRAVLHGHPRFSVIMSMICEDTSNCSITDCWKECPHVRLLGGTPVVAGEIGAGGIARNVPPVIGTTGNAIVYGHGVFSTGMRDFREAFEGMVEVENWCRSEYFRRFDEKFGGCATRFTERAAQLA
ncbi:MAG TPA: aldolase [Desulfuromonadales bacterium]|nr:aldolase [Desulfuromonadales bacterium]